MPRRFTASLAKRGNAAAVKARAQRKGRPIEPLNPATTEREYTPQEVEFMMAVQAWKDRTRNQFPNNSDLLQILLALGYRKLTCRRCRNDPHG